MIEPTSVRTFQPRRSNAALTLVRRGLLTDFSPDAPPVADGPANRTRRAALMAELPGRIDAGVAELPEDRGLIDLLVGLRQPTPKPSLSPVVMVLGIVLFALGLVTYLVR